MNKIDSKLKLLLESSSVEGYLNYRRKGTFRLEKEAGLLADDPKNFQLDKTVEYIKKLYFSGSKNDQRVLVKCLLARIKQNFYTDIVTNSIIHLGKFDELFKIIKANFIRYDQSNYLISINEITEVIRHEWTIFSSKQIQDIYYWIDDCFDGKNTLGKGITGQYGSLYGVVNNKIKTLNSQAVVLLSRSLKKNIDEDFNPEINEDELRLIQEINRLGLTKDLAETLRKIDERIENAKDDFDYKNCMDLIRSFSERLYENIIRQLTSLESEAKRIDEKESEAVAKFFVSKGLISEAQKQLLVAFRHFISNWGSHRLKSKPEDARLCKNISIELSLYLIKRLKDL